MVRMGIAWLVSKGLGAGWLVGQGGTVITRCWFVRKGENGGELWESELGGS
jgi:hypothetical protein